MYVYVHCFCVCNLFYINFCLHYALQRFPAYKYHWSGVSLPTVLEVTPCSLDQLDPTTNEVLTSYMYKDIEGIIGTNSSLVII